MPTKKRARKSSVTEINPVQLNLGFIPLRDLPSYKQEVELLSEPFFSLSKNPRKDPIHYEFQTSDGKRMYIHVTAPAEFGLATIWDADLLIYIVTLLSKTLEKVPEDHAQDPNLALTVNFTLRDFLLSTGRNTRGQDYENVLKSLRRLQRTSILTNISVGSETQKELSFSWVSSYDYDPGRFGCKVTTSRWVYDAVKTGRLLSVDKGYFSLTGGLERRLYGIIRKHLGSQSMWCIEIENLRQKCGVLSSENEFRKQVRKIVQTPDFPGYKLILSTDPEGKKPAGRHRKGDTFYLVAKKASRLLKQTK